MVHSMSQDARLDEEQATQRRARVLNLDYVDTSKIDNKLLYRDLLSVPELYDLKVIPIRVDQSNILFGVTTTTSQKAMLGLQQRFLEQRFGLRDYLRCRFQGVYAFV